MASTRVLICDDQHLIRAGLRMLLESEPEVSVAGEAGDGVAAVEACARLRPDVVLMDIRMPRMDGIEATRRILAQPGSPPRVIVLTTFDLDEHVYDALAAGASGFLLKDASPDQLLHAIRVVAAGDALLAPSVTRRLIGELVRSRPSRSAAAVSDQLTAREREVFVLIARGLSNAEIGSRLAVEESTVKTHVQRILQKLDLRDRVQAVVLAYESGLATRAV